jgi:tetratricopeptide (TPR) repeat protein
MRRQATTIILLVVSLAISFGVRDKVSSLYKDWEKQYRAKIDSQRIMPTRTSSVGMVEFMSSGMKPMIADFYWTKATTLNADKLFEMQKELGTEALPKLLEESESQPRSRADDFELYELIRDVGIFDPTFEYAFFYGGHLLSFNGNTDLAISLLEDGFKKNPKSGMIPSTLSFIYYYFLKDWERGAYYAKRSYENGGKYSMPPKGVATLFAAGQNYDLAISFLDTVLKAAKDKNTRVELKRQKNYLIVEKDIDLLQRAVNEYKKINGRLPKSLDRFIELGAISEMPVEPFGGKYYMDSNGRVSNYPENRYKHYQTIRNYIPERGFKNL